MRSVGSGGSEDYFLSALRMNHPAATNREACKKTGKPSLLLNRYRNKRQPNQYIRESQNYSSDPLDKRSVARSFPKELVNGATVSKQVRPSEISLAIFDPLQVGVEFFLSAGGFHLTVSRRN